MADGESIIIGHPEQTVSGVFIPQSPPPGPMGSPQDQAMRLAQHSAANSVAIDADASDDEIVVVATKLRQAVQSVQLDLLTYGNSLVNLPCIGPQNPAMIRGMAASLKFRITTRDFGAGRAGANLANSSTTNIPVEINNAQLKAYGLLPGGASYLVLHEIAHSFVAMRNFNKSQFNLYQARGGSGMTLEQQKANFPSSPEFAENEARANSIAKALVGRSVSLQFNFNPTHGYSTTC